MMVTTEVPLRRMALERAFSRYPANSRVEPVKRTEARAESIAKSANAETTVINAIVISICIVVNPAAFWRRRESIVELIAF
jgi:hypothetical protein